MCDTTHVSIGSVRVDLSAPKMCNVTCLCILASLLMKPLVPLPISEPGTRNRSAAYSILRMATDIKKPPHILSRCSFHHPGEPLILHHPLHTLLHYILTVLLPLQLLVQHDPQKLVHAHNQNFDPL